MDGQSLYYGMNALSHNVIMANRKKLKAPKVLHCKGRHLNRNLQAVKPSAARMGGRAQDKRGSGPGTGIKKHRHVRNNLTMLVSFMSVSYVFQIPFEKGPDLTPLFIPLAKGSNLILRLPDYAPKTQRRRSQGIFYTMPKHNSIYEEPRPCRLLSQTRTPSARARNQSTSGKKSAPRYTPCPYITARAAEKP